MRMAAIYARVSSEQQREENTIASQTASLIEFAKSNNLEVPEEWVCEDEGYSGATLERPGLERVRDLAAEGQIQVMLAYSPDRLSRKYAYQILLIEEFARQQLNAARGLLQRHVALPEAVQRLSREFDLSERQAYRLLGGSVPARSTRRSHRAYS